MWGAAHSGLGEPTKAPRQHVSEAACLDSPRIHVPPGDAAPSPRQAPDGKGQEPGLWALQPGDYLRAASPLSQDAWHGRHLLLLFSIAAK